MVCYCIFRGCKRKRYGPKIDEIINHTTELNEYQKNLLKRRYLAVLHDFKVRCSYYSWIFHTSRIIVTVGSLLVPAILSIQYSDSTVIDTKNVQTQMYWLTWGVSLLVTISNGILTLFKIDKKYYFLHTTFEQLQTEGWQYLELTGRYSGILNKKKRTPTHANQFLYFCHAIEKIKMKQVEEEYFKLSEPSSFAKLAANSQNTPPSNQQPPDTNNHLRPPHPQSITQNPSMNRLPPIDENVFMDSTINTDNLTPPEPQSMSDDTPMSPVNRRFNNLIQTMKNSIIGANIPTQSSRRLSNINTAAPPSPQNIQPPPLPHTQFTLKQNNDLFPPTPQHKRNNHVIIDVSANKTFNISNDHIESEQESDNETASIHSVLNNDS